MTSGLTVGPVDNVTSNVQALALAGEAGQGAVPVGPNQVATFEDSNDSRQFLDVPIIHARHHQRSVSPAQRQAKIRNWSISVALNTFDGATKLSRNKGKEISKSGECV
jgi:hypothetical protein